MSSYVITHKRYDPDSELPVHSHNIVGSHILDSIYSDYKVARISFLAAAQTALLAVLPFLADRQFSNGEFPSFRVFRL